MPSISDHWTLKENLLQKSEEELPKKTIVNGNVSHLVQTNSPTHNQPEIGNAAVISRFFLNPYDSKSSEKHPSLSLRFCPTVVEHNGKQFYVENGQRIERCYVQLTDLITHKIRYFEVTDYIPCQIIRRYRCKSQSP